MSIFVTTNFAALLNLIIKIRQGTEKGQLQKTSSEERKKKAHFLCKAYILSSCLSFCGAIV